MVDVAGLLQGAVVLVLWYGGSLVNKQQLDVGILTGNTVVLRLFLLSAL